MDDRVLEPHSTIIEREKMVEIIKESIEYANRKSSRTIFNVPADADAMTQADAFRIGGVELFKYFHKYYGDPASTARECYQQSYEEIAMRQFFNRLVQKGRMNSGWRYQFIAEKAANRSGRFSAISNIGTADADFSATLRYAGHGDEAVTIYVSVKNRTNTLGGQDWPGAIQHLEDTAILDRNRHAPYLCVFGIAMDAGLRQIKSSRKTHSPYSTNTEVWCSDFFWPFFTGYSYASIMQMVAEVLGNEGSSEDVDFSIPKEVTEAFGEKCRINGLVDEDGHFNDIFKLVKFFCEKRVL